MPHHMPARDGRHGRRDGRRALMLDGAYVGRAALTAILAWWTAALLLPGRTFGEASGGWFAHAASEHAWAAFCGAGALVCGSALFVRRPAWRLWSALCAACVFGVLAYGSLVSEPRSGNAGTHLVLAAWANWLAFRNAARPGDNPCRGCVCAGRWCGATRAGGPG